MIDYRNPRTTTGPEWALSRMAFAAKTVASFVEIGDRQSAERIVADLAADEALSPETRDAFATAFGR